MLLKYQGQDVPLDLEKDNVCEIRLAVPLDGVADEVHVRARVAHMVPGGIGVRFLSASGGGLDRLQRFVRECQSRELETEPVRVAPGALQPLQALKILQQLGLRRLGGLLESLLEHLQERLWLASEKLRNDAERIELSADISLLARAGKDGRFQQRMRSRLFDSMSSLESLREGMQKPAQELGSELALVDKNEFDVWLAGSALAHRLEQEFSEPLGVLRHQAQDVFGADATLPVEPQGMADALQKSLEAVGMGPMAQVLCLRSAAEHLLINLGAFYRELSQAWESAGLALSRQFSPGEAAVSASPPNAVPGHPATTGPSAVAAPPVNVSGRQLADILSTPAASAPHTLTQPQPQSQPQPVGSLQEQVAQLLSAAAPDTQALSPQMDQRIGATDQLLANMLDDPQVSSGIKDLIKRLSMRILAIAVSEPGLFADGEHPLGAVLDQLEHLSLLLPAGGSGAAEAAHRELEQLVQQALETDSRDAAALGRISKRLQVMEQEYGGEYRRKAERLASGGEGRERVRRSRIVVREQINQAYAGKRMHRAVSALIQEGWRALLQLVHLREGGQGEGWRRYWTELDKLHGLCGGEVATALPADEALTPHIAKVRGGLVFIGFDPFRASRVVQDLERAMVSVRAHVADDGDFLLFTPLPPDPDDAPNDTRPTDLESDAWRQALERVDGLAVGSAVQLQEERESVNLRLVWRSSDASELVFIEPPDMDSHTLQRRTLAESLARGQATLYAPEAAGLMARASALTLEQMQERVNYHETHDPLTGLKNQRQLIKSLSGVLSETREHFHSQVLAFVELDHLDAVSSTCGYVAGERMLVAVAKQLEISLENAQCIAYFGGSRFGFLHPIDSVSATQKLGRQVCKALTSLPFYWHGKPYPVAGSVGMVYVGENKENPENILSAVDAACLAAQRSGGGRAVLFREEDEFIAHQKDQMRWWVEAEGVVKAERLRLRGQLIAHADTDELRPHHYEVLLSVFDETGEPLPLLGFISSAETFNLMGGVDRLVVEKALNWANENPRQLQRIGGLAINLSGQSVGEAAMVDFIRERFERLRVPTELISFEVTETAAIANMDQAVAVIEGIKALGCRFALDDFGTGNASYTYLKRLPVDYLKIDGSFIKDMLTNPHDQAIVKSMIEIGHFMGKETIAEFVENQEVLEKLRELGIDHVQGYGVEKPIYLDQMN